MAKTTGNPNVKTFKVGDVTLKLGLHAGGISWWPKDGPKRLNKEQRQELCRKVLPVANAWDLLPAHVTTGPHPEQNLMAVWHMLFGGAV